MGTLFVGKCTAQDLLDDLKIIMGKLRLEMEYILSLGMGGPNVNINFFEMLNDLLQAKGKTLIDAGTCSLHTNAFGEGLKQLSFEGELNLNEFAINLHSFFKLSAKRIAQYFTVDILTELEPQRMVRYDKTRWVSLQTVLLRIMEQFPNIENYSLNILPKDKTSFNGQNGVGSNARYLAIKKMISDKRLIAVMSAVTFIAQEFRSYIVPLQSKSPLITMLFPKMQKLVQSLLSMFMNENVSLLKNNNKLKSIARISELDFSDPNNHKVKCYLGAKYANEVSLLNPLERKQVDDLMRKILITVCSYLLKKLSLRNQVIRDARHIHPKWSLDSENSPAVIDRLASTLWDALGSEKMIGLFNLKPLAKKFDFIDLVNKDLASFRLESLPETFSTSNSTRNPAESNVSKPSYWRKCYDQFMMMMMMMMMMDIKLMWRHIGLKLWDCVTLMKSQNIGIWECWLCAFCLFHWKC